MPRYKEASNGKDAKIKAAVRDVRFCVARLARDIEKQNVNEGSGNGPCISDTKKLLEKVHVLEELELTKYDISRTGCFKAVDEMAFEIMMIGKPKLKE